jgi:TusA-related sulfurtransferase
MAGKVDFVLDIRGESCPYPVIYTLDALKEMKAGQVLQVIADCPQSFRNVPEEAVKHGYELVGEPQKSGQDIYFMIRVNS